MASNEPPLEGGDAVPASKKHRVRKRGGDGGARNRRAATSSVKPRPTPKSKVAVEVRGAGTKVPRRSVPSASVPRRKINWKKTGRLIEHAAPWGRGRPANQAPPKGKRARGDGQYQWTDGSDTRGATLLPDAPTRHSGGTLAPNRADAPRRTHGGAGRGKPRGSRRGGGARRSRGLAREHRGGELQELSVSPSTPNGECCHAQGCCRQLCALGCMDGDTHAVILVHRRRGVTEAGYAAGLLGGRPFA